jgi:hypothetical protein
MEALTLRASVILKKMNTVNMKFGGVGNCVVIPDYVWCQGVPT